MGSMRVVLELMQTSGQTAETAPYPVLVTVKFSSTHLPAERTEELNETDTERLPNWGGTEPAIVPSNISDLIVVLSYPPTT